MKYKLSVPNPASHFLEIEMSVDGIDTDEILFQIPSWRPGRYELGNFAKNIQKWLAFDEHGNALPFRKISKDCWKVKANGATSIRIQYNYYAAQLDAGSCWVDEDQVYINPVHCCLFSPETIHEECFLEMNLYNAG
jgi:predicted metalloprotease with PDZ domain